MMRSIVGWALRYRGLVLGLAAATLLFAVLLVPKMPRDVLPEFVPPYVEVQTEALGLSAEEVEQLITVPLEADLLQGVAFLDEIHSESVAGLSSIVMYFEEGTDIFRARQVVAERLTQAHALPHVSKPPQMLQPLSSASRLMMISMASDDVSMIDMSILAKWTVRPRLVGVPGVANVAIFGMRERQLQVRVDPERMREHGVSLKAVIEATGNSLAVSPLTYLDASTPGTGGFIDTPNQRLGVQHVFPIRTADDLAQIRIPPEYTDGAVVRLGDIADVVEDHQLLIGDAVVNEGDGLVLVIEKFPNADTVAVTRDVEAALEALKPGLPGINVDTGIYRPATFLEQATGNVAIAIGAGVVLAAAVMFIFFRSWRAGLIGLASLVVSLAAGLLVLERLGVTLNAIVVAGLILSATILIDDAIVGVDEILRRGRQPAGDDAGQSAAWIIGEAVVQRRRALFFALLVALTAMAPLFFALGVAGAFVPPLLAAYVLGTLVSAVLAVTLTPALAALLLSGAPRDQHQTPASRRLQDRYAAILARLLDRTRPLFIAAAVVTVAVAVGTAAFGASRPADDFVPSMREGNVLVGLEGPPSASEAEMNRVLGRAAAEIRAIPGVTNVGGHVGRAITSDQVTNVNTGELWVRIDPTADHARAMDDIQSAVAGYPGIRHTVSTYTSARIDEVLDRPQRDVAVRVYGHDDATILAKAGEVRDTLGGIAGLGEVEVLPPPQEPRLRVEVDLEAAGDHGVAPGDVRRAAATLLAGIEVGNLFEDQKVFEVVVWGLPDLRHSLSSVGGIPIPTATGEVRLDRVATVSVAPGPVAIQREGVFRFVDVVGSVSGRDLGAVLADVESRVASISFPLEYRAEVLTGSLERQSAITGILVIAAAAAVMILLLLQAAFGGWRRAFAVYIALPTALIGAAIGAVVTGQVVSIGVVAGAVGVLAIAARNGLVTVDRFQELERQSGAELKPELILDGARQRFGTILASACATVLAFAPFVVLGGLPGLEVLRPVAVVTIGGVATSTLFTLFLLPAVYFRSGSSPEPDPASQLVEQPGMSPA